MRVGLVCPYDYTAPGGVQQLVSDVAAGLRARGHETVIVGAGSAEEEPEEGVVLVGGTVGIEANDSVARVALSPASWGRVRDALADVDVVHVHEPLVPLVGWSALGTGQPTVATFHADPAPWVHRAYRALPVANLMGRSVITAVSPTAAAAVPESWGPVEVIPNAIDVASYDLDAERVPVRVAFLGRDEPRKGLDVLLEAWPAVAESIDGAELKIMGADRPAAIPGVEFMGRVSGDFKKRILASSAVFAAPNLRGESFGIVVAEAMAAGCAVVASDLPAFRDVAGPDAAFTTPGDAAELAEAIIDTLENPAAAAAMGQRARARAARFDIAEIAARYEAAYHLALGMTAIAGW